MQSSQRPSGPGHRASPLRIVALLTAVTLAPVLLAGCDDSPSLPLLPGPPGGGNDSGEVQSLAARVWLQGGAGFQQADGWEVHMVPQPVREQLDLEGELTPDNVQEASVGAGATNRFGFFRINDIPKGYRVLPGVGDGSLGIADACVISVEGRTRCFERLEADAELCMGVEAAGSDVQLCIGALSQESDPWEALTEKHVLEVAPHTILILSSEGAESPLQARARLKDSGMDSAIIEMEIHDHGTGQLLETREVEVTAQGAALESLELGEGRVVITPQADDFFQWGALDFFGADPDEPVVTADDPDRDAVIVEIVSSPSSTPAPGSAVP